MSSRNLFFTFYCPGFLCFDCILTLNSKFLYMFVCVRHEFMYVSSAFRILYQKLKCDFTSVWICIKTINLKNGRGHCPGEIPHKTNKGVSGALLCIPCPDNPHPKLTQPTMLSTSLDANHNRPNSHKPTRLNHWMPMADNEDLGEFGQHAQHFPHDRNARYNCDPSRDEEELEH